MARARKEVAVTNLRVTFAASHAKAIGLQTTKLQFDTSLIPQNVQDKARQNQPFTFQDMQDILDLVVPWCQPNAPVPDASEYGMQRVYKNLELFCQIGVE